MAQPSSFLWNARVHLRRNLSAGMSVVVILGVAVSYWRPMPAAPLLAIGSALLLAFLLWRLASGTFRR